MPDRVRLRSRGGGHAGAVSLLRGDRDQGHLLAAQSLDPAKSSTRRAGDEIVRSAESRGNTVRSHEMFVGDARDPVDDVAAI